MAFEVHTGHWSVEIPRDTPHQRLDALAATGFVALTPKPDLVPEDEWRSLEFMDWKSGGPLSTTSAGTTLWGFNLR